MHPETRSRSQRSPCKKVSFVKLKVNLSYFKKNGSKETETDETMSTLTPSMDKLPIIAHLVTMISVSGKIAFSHAPSLLNSSARPCQNGNVFCLFLLSKFVAKLVRIESLI